jgi:DNA-binding response OmpR family regulator
LRQGKNAANITRNQSEERDGDEAGKPQGFPSFGGWLFDAASKSVTHDERGVVYLTDSEVALLQSFLRKPNIPIRRDILAEQIGMGGQDRAIDVQITRLRKKIEEDVKHPKLIQTIRGQGYLLRF